MKNLQVTQYISLDGIENTASAKILEKGYVPLRIYRLHSIFHLMVSKTGPQPRF